MKLNTLVGQLRLLAILEGISYVSFGLTMPLKYMMDIKGPNFYVGMAHGMLFIAYCIWVVVVAQDQKLKIKDTGLLLVASLVPFMTFWADKKILSQLEVKE
jgi:integral membrane protein